MDLQENPHIEELARAPHQIGKYKINLNETLVRRKQAQHPSRKETLLELANLSQLIDACRFAAKPPRWLPDFLFGRYDAYLLRYDGKGAIGLVKCKKGLEYNAVGWLEEETFTSVLVRGEPEAGQMRLILSDHAIKRYLERWAPQTVKDGEEALYALALTGILSPDFPAWFDDYDYGGNPSYVVVAGEVMVPVEVEARDRPRNLRATTFLFRDMHSYPGRALPEPERVKRFDS